MNEAVLVRPISPPSSEKERPKRADMDDAIPF
jgi:hypothetical protein